MTTETPVSAQLAQNLARLAKEFKSTDPGQAADIRRAFKQQSFNDATRTIVYLLEVVGSRDHQFKQLQEANTALQKENKDLRELLALNNIKIEEAPLSTDPNKELIEAITQGTITPVVNE
jgi:regulator of replication initiation timing